MTQEIYLDVFFIYNFLMDFFVLCIVGIVIKAKKCRVRSVVAAGVGATYATIVTVLEPDERITFFLTYFCVSLCMLMIAFGRKTGKELLKNVAVLYGVTFFTNGLINTVYYGTQWGKSVVLLANTEVFGKISILNSVFLLIVVLSIAKPFVNHIRKAFGNSGYFHDVTIKTGEKCIHVKALCDTGNSLMEPITRKPVSVIEKAQLSGINESNLKYFVVPYRSMGKNHGMIPAFMAEEIKLDEKIVRNVMIGIYQGRLSSKNKYQMILHPDIIKKGAC